MEIKATSKFDYETVRAFYSMYKLNHIIIYAVIFAMLEVVIIIEMIIFGFDTVLIALAIIDPVILLLVCLLALIGGKRFYNNFGKMKDAENEFTFYDDYMRVSTNVEGMSGISEIKYSVIEKVIEKPDYIYLYQNKRQAFIVDKSTITGGTVEDIRNKLMPILQKKYYCKCK